MKGRNFTVCKNHSKTLKDSLTIVSVGTNLFYIKSAFACEKGKGLINNNVFLVKSYVLHFDIRSRV